tara:strand:+ start:366 stop:773 length:408 start_codon:yes stop_codon:yes gene_type:complete
MTLGVSMTIASYNDLLNEARQQPDSQRLLFVFTRAELPDHPSVEQRLHFKEGKGGVLIPMLCVDKALEGLSNMKDFREESKATGVEWNIVFVAAMTDQGSELAERQLDRMVEAIKVGNIDSYLAFDQDGEIVSFQ